jgi:hypothetical protein
MSIINKCTEEEIAQVSEQLGRAPRGMVAVAAKTDDGEILVVATAPRIPEPFPTTYYLTHPRVVKAVSRLEASGYMRHLAELLDKNSQFYDEKLADDYARSHQAYIDDRDCLARVLGLEPLEQHREISAGGMPHRVKCLHALVGHALAKGRGENPIGDLALRELEAELGVLNSQRRFDVLNLHIAEVEN